ncbi:MAG: tRNA pseudouridine32 synthase/23S rRNA pseudouridine746 synthase [Pseudohongiellaceae bacterium]|jgi:tRNA pseudouridine32 synthase/23S rRNA pseudouridine746 synthase
MNQQNRNAPQQFHINIVNEAKPVETLASATGLSKQDIKKCMQKGAVWLSRGGGTKRLRRADRALKPQDELHLYYNPEVLNQIVPEAKLIADEGSYSIWYKPYGMLSQGSKWSDHCTITRFAEQHLSPQRAVFLVHRLDRATTGLIIIAHSKKMAQWFSYAFECRDISKKYQAIVMGDFTPMPQTKTVDIEIDDKTARSHFLLLRYNATANISLLDVDIETGRKHQIRKHLSAIGFPIVGDRLHGRGEQAVDLQLCAYELRFVCAESLQEKRFCLPQNLNLNLQKTADQLGR